MAEQKYVLNEIVEDDDDHQDTILPDIKNNKRIKFFDGTK